jgi:hypothetical protein
VGIITTDASGGILDTGAVDGVIDNANDVNYDNILISASLFQQCTLDLGSDDILDLGVLALGNVSDESHTVSVQCNADNGFTVSVLDSGGFSQVAYTSPTQDHNSASDGVTFGDATTVNANPTSDLLSVCADAQGCFGIHIARSTGAPDPDMTCDPDLASGTAEDGTLASVTGEYAGIDGTGGTATVLCSATDPVTADATDGFDFTAHYAVAMKADAPAGVYSDLVVFVLSPNF